MGHPRKREREREREKEGVAAVRDTTLGKMEILILFEGSQAMPASPSDRGEILFKVIEVRGGVGQAVSRRFSPYLTGNTPG
jgi:hypothetical protein